MNIGGTTSWHYRALHPRESYGVFLCLVSISHIKFLISAAFDSRRKLCSWRLCLCNTCCDPWRYESGSVRSVIATIAGMIAGGVTGFLHTVFDIPAILSGNLDPDCPLVHQSSDYGKE